MKIKITSEVLQKWLLENGVKISRLAELMDMPAYRLSHYFAKTPYIKGGNQKFTPAMAERVNAAMRLMSKEISELCITYSLDESVVRRGRVYFPKSLDKIRALRQSFQIKPFVKKSLGWSESKWNAILVSKVNSAYGNITEEHLNAINMNLLQIAAALDNFELQPDLCNDSSSSSY